MYASIQVKELSPSLRIKRNDSASYINEVAEFRIIPTDNSKENSIIMTEKTIMDKNHTKRSS